MESLRVFAAQARDLFATASTRGSGRTTRRPIDSILQAIVLLSVILVAVPLVLGAGPAQKNSSAQAMNARSLGPLQSIRHAASEPVVTTIDELKEALATHRGSSLAPLSEDEFLTSGTQSWTKVLAATGEVKHEPGLRSQMQDTWKGISEFVASAPSVDIAYQRLLANPQEVRALSNPNASSIAVAVESTTDGIVYVVVRIASN
jgi:hypothetical protein